MADNIIGEAAIAVKASFDEFNKDMKTVQSSMEKALAPAQKKFADLGKSVTNVGKNMTKGLTVPIVAVGTAAFAAGDTVDDAFDTIRKGTGATGPELEALGKDFKAVFAEVPQDAGTVSAAIADLNTRLGLTGQPLQDLTKQMLDLSRIAGTDVTTTIEAATRLFGDWSIETEKQSESLDYLWKVSQQTGIGVDTLSQKMVQFGAPLRQMGFSFEESAALMGKWEKEGVNSELVLGSLRIAMGQFAKDNIPMREGLDQTIKKIQELGPGAESTALAMDVFGARAGPDMAAAILEGRFAVDDLMNSIEASPETISSASDDIAGFGEAMAEMKNQITLALEPLGKVLLDVFEQIQPYLQKAIDFISQLIQKFGELDPQTQAIILGVIGLVAALGPVLMVLGPVISGFGSLLKIIPVLSSVFGFLTGPIGLVVLAIAGAVAAGVALYKNWDEISKWLSDVWNWIAETASGIWNGIVEFFAGIWESISTAVTDAWNGIVEFVTGIWNGIVETATSIWESIKNAILQPIQDVIQWFQIKWLEQVTFADSTFNKIKDIATSVWDGIKNAIMTPINIAKNLITTIWNGIKTFLSNLWNGIKTIATNVWNAIKSFITNPIETVKNVLTSIWNGLKNTLSNIWNGIKNTANTVWTGVKNVIMTPINSLKGLLSDVWNGITSTASNAWNGLKKTASDIFGKVKDAILAPFKNLHIPLPHFSFSIKHTKIAGINVPYPDVDVDWYAKGAIFTSPQIIGVGEAGPEAVVPLDKLNAIITDAVNRVVGEQTKPVTVTVQNMNVRSEDDIYRISRELNNLIQSSQRARGTR